MRKSVLITTDFPTVEQVAEWSGVSPKRTKALMRLVDDIVAKRANSRSKPSKPARNTKNAAKAKTTGEKPAAEE